jgi:hypothetical protein
MEEAQEVRLAVRISGYYAAWHEISHRILWDYTNDKGTGSYSKEEAEEALEEGHDGEDSDCQMMDGILYKGKYYINL